MIDGNRRQKNDYFQMRLASYLTVLLTFFLYIGSVSGEWLLSWDDQIYVVGNSLIKTISLDNLSKIFSSFYYTDYQPVSLLSYMIDYMIWGDNPVGYRITNMILHAINGVLVFIVARRLFTKSLSVSEYDAGIIAAIASCIFVTHPTAVESVIWISERKNLLSETFLLLSFISYSRYRETELRRFLYLSTLLFAFALLSKASAVVFPVLLILYDYCIYASEKKQKGVWLEKAPLFVMSLISGILTVNAEAHIGAVKDYPAGSRWYQLLVTLRALACYIWNSLFPINLSAYYAVPGTISLFEPGFLMSITLLLILSVVAAYFVKRSPLLFFCIGWFFISLSPVSGIIPLSNLMADRYLYIPMVGFAIILSLCLYEVSRGICLKVGINKVWIIYLLAFAIVSNFAGLTVSRARIWEDELTLWEDTLRKEPRAPYLYGALGKAYIDKGMPDKAIILLSKGMTMLNENSEVAKDMRYTRGYAFYRMGDRANAKIEFERLVKIDPGYPSAYFGLFLINGDAGHNDEALRAIDRYMELFDLIPKGKVYSLSLEDAKKNATILNDKMQKAKAKKEYP